MESGDPGLNPALVLHFFFLFVFSQKISARSMTLEKVVRLPDQ